MNNTSFSSRIAAFGLALSVTVAMLVAVASLAHVEPAQTMAVADANVGRINAAISHTMRSGL